MSQRSSDLSPGGSRVSELFNQLLHGEISRRDFIARGTALGASLSLLHWLVRGAQTVGAAPHPQDATPAATPGGVPTPVAVPPSVGTEGKTRGQDGELKLLFWQAINELSPHVANGTTNVVASQLVVEPLLRIFEDGSIQPNLLSEVPSIANGGLNAELTELTLKLMPNVTWSDGTPFTSDDVVFTHGWVTDPANGALSIQPWQRITEITAVDPLTVQVRFGQQNFNWYESFATQQLGTIYPRHFVEAGGDMRTAPIGTGPFIVESFAPNDQVIFTANPMYRDAARPFFARVNLRGGGDVATAVQSVVQTGDWDYVWNVQLEPDLITQYLEGGQGQIRALARTTEERLNFNFSDPRAAGPDGQMSYWEIPHPILSDPAVRQAISLGVDRDLILNQLYNPNGERTTPNVITGNPGWESPNTTWAHDPDQANQILDDAGWTRSGDAREKNGVRLELALSTSINSVRQKTQIIVQQNLREIGVTIQLEQVDAGIFFDSSAGNTQNLNHMYTDINMFSSGAPLSLPITYVGNWTTGGEGAPNIAQSSNGWAGTNTQRYQNPDYDAEWAKLNGGGYATIEEAAQSIIRLNDMLMADNVVVPLVNRAAGSESYAIHNSLIHGDDKTTGEDNYGIRAFDDGFWNIANWNRSEPVNR